MKTNKTIFALLLLVVSLLSVSCIKDYIYDTFLYIKNNSTHDIEIFVELPTSEIMYYGSVTINRGEIIKKGVSTDGGFMPPAPLSVQLKFDDGIMITHRYEDGDTYHNFCSETAFEKKVLGKRSVEYTFEFTDEDYEYAVRNADNTE